MKAGLLVPLILARISIASPARSDCGETKTYIATNECGATFGGTWVECAEGLTAMPTFTKPFCSTPYRALAGGYGAQETPIADPRVIPTRTPTTATASSIITSAPPPDFFEVLRAKSHSGTQSCTPLMICEDGIAVCAGTTQMWGGCFDACDEKARPSMPPSCSAPVATAGQGYNRKVPDISLVDPPQSEATTPCTKYCPPPNW